jgi:tetratricopeptide (TPR) repeat protein
MKQALLPIIAVLLLSQALLADTIVLKNGQKIEGRIISETDSEVTLRISNIGSMTFKRSEIKKIERDSATGDKYLPSDEEELTREREKERLKERRAESEKNLPKPVAPDAGATEDAELDNTGENTPGKTGSGKNEKVAGGDNAAEGESAEEGGETGEGGEMEGGESADTGDLDQLIFNLGHKKPGYRANAREKLAAMGKDAVDKLMTALSDANQYRAQNAAWALGQIGDPKALKALEAVQSSGAGNEWTQKEIAEAIRLITEKNPVETAPANIAEPIYQRGLRRENAGDFKGAIAEYTAAIKRSGAYGPAWIARAVRLFNDERNTEAAADLVNAARLEPAFSEYFKKRGLEEKSSVSLADVSAVYTDALADNASNPEALLRRGVARILSKDFAASKSDLEAAAALKPSDIQLQFLKAYAIQLSGNDSEAVAEYAALIKKAPSMVKAYIARAEVYMHARNFDNAMSDYVFAIRLNPTSPIVYNGRGKANAALGDFDNAISDYDKAISLDPEYAFAYANRADVKYKKEDWSGAVADYDEMLKRRPDDGVSYKMRGQAKKKLGDEAGSEADLKKAAELGNK